MLTNTSHALFHSFNTQLQLPVSTIYRVFLKVLFYILIAYIGLLSFYIFFQSRLIPTLFLILSWGYQPERVQDGIYLLFYTLIAPISLLVGILFISNSLGSLCFLLSGNGFLVGGLFYICMVFAFFS